MTTTLGVAFASVEAKYRADILEATWGHLAVTKNKTYRGTLIVAWGTYNSGHLNPTIVQDNMGIESSPWWYDAVHSFVGELKGDYCDTGFVVELRVTFRNYRFWLTGQRVLVKG